jgi:flagellar L-ring protein precursor FlgH
MISKATKSSIAIGLVSSLCIANLSAQELSSSLFLTGGSAYADPFYEEVDPFAPPVPGTQTDNRRLSPAIAATSFMAVQAPEPRTFGVHDLVTIIIREEMSTDFTASLETEKSTEFAGEIAEFPRITLGDLIEGQIAPNTFPDGTLQLDISLENEFEGEGDYSNRQTMIGRVQARVIDVKPNGTLVIEARKSVTSDREHYTLVATGTCRVDDITIDNTILSSQLADLYLEKQHSGNLKRAADKGLITNFFDFFFNF